MTGVQRVLVANRGEIVVRIARTARRLGIATVAIHSDADRDAPHVRACDDALGVGGFAATESYLNRRILEAARIAHADAIHPGYGFLAENPEFAAAVEAAGLTFIGPPSAAIAARWVTRPGTSTHGGGRHPGPARLRRRGPGRIDLRQHAARVGYPVMIKAAAGGGGRGMRLVHAEPEFAAALRAATSEAAKAFGDGRLILERALVEPRHVEIQVLADRHGHVIHLGERDCPCNGDSRKSSRRRPRPPSTPHCASAWAPRPSPWHGDRILRRRHVEFLLDRDGRYASWR